MTGNPRSSAVVYSTRYTTSPMREREPEKSSENVPILFKIKKNPCKGDGGGFRVRSWEITSIIFTFLHNRGNGTRGAPCRCPLRLVLLPVYCVTTGKYLLIDLPNLTCVSVPWSNMVHYTYILPWYTCI